MIAQPSFPRFERATVSFIACDHVRNTEDREDLSYKGWSDIAVIVDKQSFGVKITVAKEGEVTCRLLVDTVSPSKSNFSDAGLAGYYLPLDRGVRKVGNRNIYRKIFEILQGHIFSEQWEFYKNIKKTEKSEYSQVFKKIYKVLSDAATHSADCCEPAPRSLALKFVNHIHWYVYSLFVENGERMMQLTNTCPGLLIFLHNFHRIGQFEIEKKIIEEINKATKLTSIIRLSLDYWCELVSKSGYLDSGSEERLAQYTRPTFWRFWDASPQEMNKFKEKQSILIKRAKQKISPTLLWRPAPLFLIPEDIPEKVYSNSRWYKRIQNKVFFHPAQRYDESYQRALIRFVSKHAESIPKCWRYTDALSFMEEREWLVSRQTPFKNFQKEFLQWRRTRRRQVRDAGDECVEIPAEFAPQWISNEDTDGFSIQYIGTPSDLDKEARKQSNCVSTYKVAITKGLCQIYSVSLNGTRITVSISKVRNDEKLYLSEAKSFANRELDRSTIEVLRAKLQSKGIER